MTAGARVLNCTLDAPGYGSIGVICTELGYGMNIVSNESQARNTKTFYPYVRTSGLWYVTLKFPDAQSRRAFNNFTKIYLAAISNPYTVQPGPMTVSVPTRNFLKVGYPDSALEFDESVGEFSWEYKMTFVSASEPTMNSSKASKYVPPLARAAVNWFNLAEGQLTFGPADLQSRSAVDPVPFRSDPLSGQDVAPTVPPPGSSGGPTPRTL